MDEKNEATAREDIDVSADWEALDSRLSAAIREIESTLEEALAATRGLSQWVERLRTLSGFIRQVELGLGEVRQGLGSAPRGAQPAPPAGPGLGTVAEEETRPPEWAVAEAEAGEEPQLAAPEVAEAAGALEVPAEGGPGPAKAEEQPEAIAAAEAEPVLPTQVAEHSDKIRLALESSEANIDLMVVERALRDTPGVADVDLLDYAGRRARVEVTLSPGERPEEVSSSERLTASVRERLGKLTWDASLSVSESE